MKCPNCGSEEFYKEHLCTDGSCTDGGAWRPIEIRHCAVNAYVCKKCGRVEIYAEDSLAKIQVDNKRAEDEAKRKAQKEAKIHDLQVRYNHLMNVINDENQTVKAVKDAKEEMHRIENELRILGSYPKRLDNGVRGN